MTVISITMPLCPRCDSPMWSGVQHRCESITGLQDPRLWRILLRAASAASEKADQASQQEETSR